MDLNQLLKEQKYSISENEIGIIKIKNHSLMNNGLAIASFIAGIFFFLMLKLDPKFIILSLLFWSSPFIYSRWRYPKEIIIDANNYSLTLFKSYAKTERYEFKELEPIVVFEEIRSSHTSAFEEGNKDYNYYFHASFRVRDGQLKLMNFKFRNSQVDKMQYLAKYLNNKLSQTS